MKIEHDLHRLSLATIRCVREVMLAQSVSVAAQRLEISQPAVSQHLARFEKLSGIAVVSRTGNTLSANLAPVAPFLAAVAELERVLALVGRTETSRPRIGLDSGIAHFYYAGCAQRYDLTAYYDLHIGTAPVLEAMYARGELDILVQPVLPGQPEPSLTIAIERAWIGRRFGPPPRGGKTPADPIPLIAGTDDPPGASAGERTLRQAGLNCRIVARVDDQMALLGLVAAGAGYAEIPAALVASLPHTIASVDDLPAPLPTQAGARWHGRAISGEEVALLFYELFDLPSAAPERRPGRKLLAARKPGLATPATTLPRRA